MGAQDMAYNELAVEESALDSTQTKKESINLLEVQVTGRSMMRMLKESAMPVSVIGARQLQGTANNLNEGSWAKTSEGHAFGSRPSALTFKYKFDSSNSTPFYASVSILSEDGTLLASGTSDNNSTSVSSWTDFTIPLEYKVTDKKAGMIKMSFRSSPKGTEKSRAKTVTTLSGEHDIHAGNILYLDDITLKYE